MGISLIFVGRCGSRTTFKYLLPFLIRMVLSRCSSIMTVSFFKTRAGCSAPSWYQRPFKLTVKSLFTFLGVWIENMRCRERSSSWEIGRCKLPDFLANTANLWLKLEGIVRKTVSLNDGIYLPDGFLVIGSATFKQSFNSAFGFGRGAWMILTLKSFFMALSNWVRLSGSSFWFPLLILYVE